MMKIKKIFKITKSLLLLLFYLFITYSICKASGGKMSKQFRLEFSDLMSEDFHCNESAISRYERRFNLKILNLLRKIYKNEIDVKKLFFYSNERSATLDCINDIETAFYSFNEMKDIFGENLFPFGYHGSAEIFFMNEKNDIYFLPANLREIDDEFIKFEYQNQK